MTPKPLVSIVTPVHNGEAFLGECIQSVLAQDYEDWEYVIVNNRSTDRTLEIATRYARLDTRIRVYDNPRFLPLVGNWNHALRQISFSSRYCKVVHSDDLLGPTCLSSMVALAEAHPEVGLITSRFFRGSTVWPVDFPFAEGVISGDDAIRFYFQTRVNYIGSPSNVLLRSEIVRGDKTFHNEANQHTSDLEAWLTLLARYSLGFIDRVLTSTRIHDASVTSTWSKRLQMHHLSRLYLLLRHGEKALEPRELQRRVVEEIWLYERILARRLLAGDFELLRQHRQQLRSLGIAPLRTLAATTLKGLEGAVTGRAKPVETTSSAD